MKSRLLFVLVPALFGLARVSAAQSSKQPQDAKPWFSITISTPHSTIKAGAEVRVIITMSNISDHKIRLSRDILEDNGESNNNLEILDHNGKPATETRYGRRLRGEGPKPGEKAETHSAIMWSDILFFVDPGKTLQDIIIANKLYDFSQPGKYTIQASRFDNAYSMTWVKSNIITLTVVP